MMPKMLERLTICASGRSLRCGRNSIVPCTTPQKLMPISHSMSSSESCATAPMSATPALLMTRSTRPCAARTASRNAVIASREETSTRCVETRRPAAPASIATAASASTLISASASSQPSRARRSASARPMPLAAPVTTATVPASARIGSIDLEIAVGPGERRIGEGRRLARDALAQLALGARQHERHEPLGAPHPSERVGRIDEMRGRRLLAHLLEHAAQWQFHAVLQHDHVGEEIAAQRHQRAEAIARLHRADDVEVLVARQERAAIDMSKAARHRHHALGQEGKIDVEAGGADDDVVFAAAAVDEIDARSLEAFDIAARPDAAMLHVMQELGVDRRVML